MGLFASQSLFTQRKKHSMYTEKMKPLPYFKTEMYVRDYVACYIRIDTKEAGS